MESAVDLTRYRSALDRSSPIVAMGRVTKVAGFVTEADGPATQLGGICHIYPANLPRVKAEVLGFRDNRVLLVPLG